MKRIKNLKQNPKHQQHHKKYSKNDQIKKKLKLLESLKECTKISYDIQQINYIDSTKQLDILKMIM